MDIDPVTLSPPDDRRGAILEAAFATLCRYGTRRTSMEDIAREAGMSRAALYLHFRNKDDIIKSLAAHYFAKAINDLKSVLQVGGDLRQVMRAGLDASGGEAFGAMLASPHGQELLDTKLSVSAAEARAGEEALKAIWVEWFDREAAAGRLTLETTGGDARAMAESLFGAWHGFKAGGLTPDSYAQGLDRIAAIFARALRP